MVQDLSLTLRSILTQPGPPPPLASAQIVFDRPSDPFTPSQTTVDMFLYDLRENLEQRSNELSIDKIGTQSITHKAPLRAGRGRVRQQRQRARCIQSARQRAEKPAQRLRHSAPGLDPMCPPSPPRLACGRSDTMSCTPRSCA